MVSIKKELHIGHTQRLAKLMRYLGIHVRTKTEEMLLAWRQHSEWKAKLIERAARVNRQIAMTHPTSIEKAMANALDAANIKYEFQAVIAKRYPCDFVIPASMLVVECDGTYWHSTPEARTKDARKDAFLQACGYTVLRFSDKVIKKDIDSCVVAIKALLLKE